MVFRTAITLQNTVLAVFVKFIHRLYDFCQPRTVSPIWDVLFILLPAPSLVFCDTQCSLCSTGRLVFLRFIDSRVKFHGNNLYYFVEVREKSMKRPVQERWRQTSFSHYSILSLTNMALFRFRLVNYFKNRWKLRPAC